MATTIASVSDPNVIGTISYNGYTFPSLRNAKVKFSPKYDDTGRVRVATEVTLVVAWILTTGSGESSHSGSLDLIRTKLCEPGKDLDCTGVGLGSYSVGGAANGSRKGDMLWGPRPQICEVESLSFQASMLVWSCTFALADCGTADGSSGAYAIEHAFEITYAIDERGLLTRTVRGHLLIAARRSGTSITANADSLREQMAQRVPVPTGFARSQTWQESADHSRLDFTFTDRQLESDDPYPPGITSIDVDISASSGQVGFTSWNIVVSGSVETAPGTPRDWGYTILYKIFSDRLQYIKGVGSKRTIVPVQYSVSRALYGRRTSATIVYSVIDEVAKEELIKDVGLYNPLPGNWSEWHNSLAKHQSARGVSGMGNPMPAGDAITNPCVGGLATFRVSADQQALNISVGNLTAPLEAKVEDSASYQRWECWLGTNYRQSLTRQKNIQSFVPATVDIGGSKDKITNLWTEGGAKITGETSAPTSEDTLQFSSAPSGEVWLIGRAIRLGKPVVVPRIKQVNLVGGGTVAVTESDADIKSAKVGMHGAVPMYAARWSIRYYTAIPINGALEQIPNPITKEN